MTDQLVDPAREQLQVFLKRLPSTLLWAVPAAIVALAASAAAVGYQYATHAKEVALDAMRKEHALEMLEESRKMAKLERDLFASQTARPPFLISSQTTPAKAQSTPQEPQHSEPQPRAQPAPSQSQPALSIGQSTDTRQPEPGQNRMNPQVPFPLQGDAADSLSVALRNAQHIVDHRIRDATVLKIACQALQQGASLIAESAADSLSAAKEAERFTIKGAAQAIISPHRRTPNWQALCA